MSVTDTTVVQVRNLTDHDVVYYLDDKHLRRVFSGFETKKIKAGELREAYYQDGGYLFNNTLCIENEELAEEFGVDIDTPEYWWTLEDVDNLLLTGSTDALLDALDFGPEGIIDTIVSRAVELKINDIEKREIIEEGTGFGISNMIRLKEEWEKITERPKEEIKTRRVKKSESSTSGRRVKPEN